MRINNRLDFVLAFGTIELPCKVQVWLRAQGCGACGLGFRVQGLEFGVWVSGLSTCIHRAHIEHLPLRVGIPAWLLVSGFRVS